MKWSVVIDLNEKLYELSGLEIKGLLIFWWGLRDLHVDLNMFLEKMNLFLFLLV